MKRIYRGSCHCGAIHFECDLDLTEGSRRCNCTFCSKTRMWKAFVGKDSFRLLKGKDSLSDYRADPSLWAQGNVNHFFCKGCGIRPFSRGWLEQFGGEFYAINVAALDNASDQELANVPIQYEDGLNNQWEASPRDYSHL